MRLVLFHVVQMGLVLVGAHSQLKEITTDSQKEINRRSIITLESGVEGWTPSMLANVKRHDTFGRELGGVSTLHGRMPRSASLFLISGPQRKSRRAVSKHSGRQSGEIKIHQLRKRSKHGKSVYSKQIKVKVSSKTTHVNKLQVQYKLKVKSKIETKTKTSKKKGRHFFKKARKTLRKLTKKSGQQKVTHSFKMKTSIKHK